MEGVYKLEDDSKQDVLYASQSQHPKVSDTNLSEIAQLAETTFDMSNLFSNKLMMYYNLVKKLNECQQEIMKSDLDELSNGFANFTKDLLYQLTSDGAALDSTPLAERFNKTVKAMYPHLKSEYENLRFFDPKELIETILQSKFDQNENPWQQINEYLKTWGFTLYKQYFTDKVDSIIFKLQNLHLDDVSTMQANIELLKNQCNNPHQNQDPILRHQTTQDPASKPLSLSPIALQPDSPLSLNTCATSVSPGNTINLDLPNKMRVLRKSLTDLRNKTTNDTLQRSNSDLSTKKPPVTLRKSVEEMKKNVRKQNLINSLPTHHILKRRSLSSITELTGSTQTILFPLQAVAEPKGSQNPQFHPHTTDYTLIMKKEVHKKDLRDSDETLLQNDKQTSANTIDTKININTNMMTKALSLLVISALCALTPFLQSSPVPENLTTTQLRDLLIEYIENGKYSLAKKLTVRNAPARRSLSSADLQSIVDTLDGAEAKITKDCTTKSLLAKFFYTSPSAHKDVVATLHRLIISPHSHSSDICTNLCYALLLEHKERLNELLDQYDPSTWSEAEKTLLDTHWKQAWRNALEQEPEKGGKALLVLEGIRQHPHWWSNQ
jgi:hypothetical protein